MSVASAKVPVTIATGVICLAAGVGLGALGKQVYDKYAPIATTSNEVQAPENPTPPPGAQGMGAGMAGGRGGPGGGGGGGGGRGGGGGNRGPSPKAQLTELVKRLNLLVKQPLVIELTAEEQKELHKQVAELAELDKLTDDDAKKHLDALQKALGDKKSTLDSAAAVFGRGGGGGGGGGGGAAGPPSPPDINPFKNNDDDKKIIKSLESKLKA
jgi:hypothetical protein